jgi:hypothetical protein
LFGWDYKKINNILKNKIMKLESLKDFQLNIIEKEKMSNFFGGNGRALELLDAGKETGGGEVCATSVGNSTGGTCTSYSSDWDPGNGYAISLYGVSDNSKVC